MPTVVIPLTAEGAVVEVWVGVSQQRAAALGIANHPVPPAVPIRLLVDTGASTTSIAAGLLAPLGLTPTGSTSMHTPSTGGVPVNCDQYDVGIAFPTATPVPWTFPIVPVIECHPLTGTVQGLLGRDVLNHCVLTYTPQAGHMTISF